MKRPPKTSRERCTATESSDRAVSDVVAFVLTFSIIIAGVGIVSIGGLDQLTHFTETQQVQNSERGMQAAASTIDNLHANTDTYREFDVSVSSGTVWFNETALTLDSNGDFELGELPGADQHTSTIAVGALEQRFDRSGDDVTVAYEAGGVFRSDSATARYQPSIQCGGTEGDTTIISLVNLTTTGDIEQRSGPDGDVRIRPRGIPEEAPLNADNQILQLEVELVDQDRILETDLGSNNDITVDVSETAYPGQWGTYFDENGWDEDGDEYSCTSERVLIRISTIELDRR